MKKIFILILIITFSIAIRILFLEHTNYVAEDAHITFQFSRNIERGDGFSENPGIPIYGSTTPLLTLLLAGWLFISKDIVLGARLIDIISVILGMIFLYITIPNKNIAIIALFILAFSSKLYIEEMQGMEMPLLFFFGMASLYGFIKRRPCFSGIMSGLLLWTRIDTVIWIGCLFLIYLWTDYRQSYKYGLITFLTYLPWVVFSWLYFGSPVPFTIIAKQVAYGINNPPYWIHLERIIDYISWPVVIFTVISIFIIKKEKIQLFLILFVITESSQLILTGSTFFTRYFYLLTLVCYVIISFILSDLLDVINYRIPIIKSYTLTLVLLFVFSFSLQGIKHSLEYYKFFYEVRQKTLIEIGQWLNTVSSPKSTILLEPLGYVGWYADRFMIDEVGLVSPKVVDLHRHGVPSIYFYQVFWPDYIIWTCGEGGVQRDKVSKYYDLIKIFDGHVARSCYEIRARKPDFAYILP